MFLHKSDYRKSNEINEFISNLVLLFPENLSYLFFKFYTFFSNPSKRPGFVKPHKMMPV